MKMRERRLLTAPAPPPNIPLLVSAVINHHARQAYLAQRRSEDQFAEWMGSGLIDAIRELNQSLMADIERMTAERQCPGNTDTN